MIDVKISVINLKLMNSGNTFTVLAKYVFSGQQPHVGTFHFEYKNGSWNYDQYHDNYDVVRLIFQKAYVTCVKTNNYKTFLQTKSTNLSIINTKQLAAKK